MPLFRERSGGVNARRERDELKRERDRGKSSKPSRHRLGREKCEALVRDRSAETLSLFLFLSHLFAPSFLSRGTMLKRAAEDPYAPPVPLKRRSVEIDPSLRAEWRQAAQQQQAISSPPSSQHQQPSAGAAVDAISGLTADDWCVLFFSFRARNWSAKRAP